MLPAPSPLHFFISYTSADKEWAEWVGFILEEERLNVRLQGWDFLPGSNFVLEMQDAADHAERTIMVVSPAYLESQFAAPEWAAAFVNDPRGAGRKLIPVMVEKCDPKGMLKSIVHIDLTNLGEDDARKTLLAGLAERRAKPDKRPSFPGAAVEHATKAFPGHGGEREVRREAATPYIPKLPRSASDIDKRRFTNQAFTTIAGYFESALTALTRQRPGVEGDFERESETEFSAEIFIGGKSVAVCRVWRGDAISGEAICYAEGAGHSGRNSYNEVLTPSDESGDLCFRSMMGVAVYGQVKKEFDLQRLTEDQAGEYLWRRFVARLER